MRAHVLASSLMLVLVAVAAPAYGARDQDRAVREAMRRAQLEVRQVQQENVQLEADKAKLSQELEAAKKTASKEKAIAAHERRKRRTAEKNLQGTRDELAKLQEKSQALQKDLAELNAKQADTTRKLAQVEAEKKRADATIVAREQTITACEDKNAKLYAYGRELMVKYEKKSCEDALKQAEPFTGLKKVEIENLLEAYRDKLDDERVLPSINK